MIISLGQWLSKIVVDAYVAVCDGSSVWAGSVLRGDLNKITVGGFVLMFRRGVSFMLLGLLLQIINVYNQQYESVAAFWPHVHGRIIASLLISQLLLMGLLRTKKAAKSTPLLVVLPVLTLAFHKYCKHRFEPAFRKYPLEEVGEREGKFYAINVQLKDGIDDTSFSRLFKTISC